MKKTLFYITIILITIIWMILLVFKYTIVLNDYEINSRSQWDYFIAEKLLRISSAPEMDRTSMRQVYIQNAKESFESVREKNPENGKLLCYNGIILAETGETKRALTTFLMAEKDPSARSLGEVLIKIYSKEHVSSKEVKKYEKILYSNLKGWFLNSALFALYEKAGERRKADSIKAEGERAGSILIYKLFGIISIILLLEIVGTIFVIFYILRIRKKGEMIGTPEIGWSLAEAWFVFIIWNILQMLIGKFILFSIKVTPSIFLMVFIVMMNYALAAVLIFSLIKIRRGNFVSSLGLIGDKINRAIIFGAGGFLAALPVVTIAVLLGSLLLRKTSFSSNPVLPLLSKPIPVSELILLFVLVALVGPIFEEIVFRGFLYPSFRKLMKPWLAMVLVSIIFSFLHVDPAGIMPIFGLGLILAYLYERTGSLISPIFLHCLWNSLTFALAVTFFWS